MFSNIFEIDSNNIEFYIDKIKSIMKEYGCENLIDAAYILASLIQSNCDVISKLQYRDRKEDTLFIQFLRACRGSKIELKGTITKPQGEQIQGTELKATISADNPFLEMVYLFANTWVEREQDGMFIDEFNWKCKETIELTIPNQHLFENKDTYNFTEPYTDEELSQIFLLYDKKERACDKGKFLSRHLGETASRIENYVDKMVTESSWTKTKLYSFIYDVMLLGKPKINQSYTSREKLQAVTNWIDAYKRSKKKADKKATQKED